MNTQEIEEQYLVPTYGSRQLTLVKGEEAYLFDETGKQYIDCCSNYGVNVLGHSRQEIIEVIEKQSKQLLNLHGSFHNPIRALFAQQLIEKAPNSLSKVFFSNSGAEAVEAALKFARLHTNKTKLIAAKKGYHGKTLGALSLTNTLPKYTQPFEPYLLDVIHVKYNDIDELSSTIDHETAAVILEPIQGEGGIIVPDDEYFNQVRKLCDDHNCLLIIDEIQTGMGRTGTLFASEHWNIQPDIMCLAKGIAAGLPMGATLVSEKIACSLYSGAHTNTFGGNPLACAVGCKVLELLDNSFLSEAAQKGNYFLRQLKSIDSSIIRDIRGKGLMLAIEFKRKVSPIAKELQDQGIIAIPTGSTVLRLLPPLVISQKDINTVVTLLQEVVL